MHMTVRGPENSSRFLGRLRAARDDGPRRTIIREAWNAIRAKGPCLGSAEELPPVRGDPAAALPLTVTLAATLIHPAIWKTFHAGAVGPYALTPDACWPAHDFQCCASVDLSARKTL